MSEPTKAFCSGKEYGKERGTLVLDGESTPQYARRILQGYDEGDLEIMNLQPDPFSRDDDSIPELSRQYGIDLEDDDTASDFVEGYGEGFWDEVLRSARAIWFAHLRE